MKELCDIDLKQLIEQETGQRFVKGQICCPFHKEKTPSFRVRFDSNANKEKFKCFGCGASGDAIDFISKFKNIDYINARKYLGLHVEKSENEKEVDKVKSYIEWQLSHQKDKKGFRLLGLFQFVDDENKPLYYKAKFLKQDGKKITPYYHVEDGKVINSRGVEEVPYNLYNVTKAIQEEKILIITEGEKDANTLNMEFKNSKYVATSVKGLKDFKIFKKAPLRVYVIGDTGEAGSKYKEWIKEELFDNSIEFKIINLPHLKLLGDNKDVTDWLEAGNNKYDLLNAFKRSLDLKDNNELKQNWRGIYKTYYDKKEDENKRFYITDFQILEVKRLRFFDDDKEGIKLTLKSCTGDILIKIGPSTVFDDIRSFKNFLGTIDLSFMSKNIEDLTKLKIWINKYWAIDNETRYSGVQYIEKDNKLMLVTKNGAIGTEGNDYSIITDISDIDLINIEQINTEELKKVKNKIFKFWDASKSISIIGTTINDLAAYHNEQAGEKLHILLIVGESGSGKSTILERVVAPILNYPLTDKKSIGSTSQFAIQKDLSTGNYPTIYDEFKPSMMDKYKWSKLSGIFRDLHDRTITNKGDKSFKIRSFRLQRPLIMAGEELFPNNETAVITRSCIVYLSKRERTEKNTEAMHWLMDNQVLLNKLGRSLVNTILNLSVDEYKEIRKNKRKDFEELKERALGTALNIACGIEIFNKLLEEHGLKKITGYEKYIFQNIKEEILDGGNDTKSVVEQMLILYNSMIEDGRAYEVQEVVIDRGDGLFIRTSEMINQIHMFVNQVGSAEVIPLKLRDFKKQAQKAGYLIGMSSKVIKINNKTVRFDEYSKNRMRELKVDNIVEPELTPVDNNGKVIEWKDIK